MGSFRSPAKDSHSIRLRWHKSFEGENWNYSETGFLWSLSFLGATLPEGCKEKMIVREKDSVTFTLDLRHAGFSEQAMDSWKVIIDSLKKSEEYIINGAMDMGRFVMLTENSSWHYYAITGVHKTLDAFQKQYQFTGTNRFLVVNSGVSKGERLIYVAPANHIHGVAFMAQVGEGSARTGDFRPTEIEVFDIMPNSQLRFAVYGSDGKLKPFSDPQYSQAGKPSKCLWCHESHVQPLFYGDTDVEGFMPAATFLGYIDSAMQLINRYRASLSTEIDYTNTHHHTWSELNYIGFATPTAERIAREFNVSTNEALQRISGIASHDMENFPFYYRDSPYFGTYKGMFDRNDIDKLLPYLTIRTPDDPIEPGTYEPDFFNPETVRE